MQHVENVIKRSRRYWYVDGITELYMGSISLLAGLFYLGFEGINALAHFLFVPTQAEPFLFLSPWAVTVLISYLILFILLVNLTLFLQQRATKFRESFTYPRIGYLAPRTSKRAPNLILATIFIGIQLLLAYMFIIPLISLISPDISPNIILFVGCLFFSCLYLYPAVSSALARFYVLSALSTLLSIVLFQTSISPGINMILYTTLMGVALLISGGYTFQNFSRQNPLSQDELLISNDLENAEQAIEENMTKEEIEELLKRSPRYWFMDGIMELNLGGVWILTGICNLGNAGNFALSSYLYLSAPGPLFRDSWVFWLQGCLMFIFWILWICSIIVFKRRLMRRKERFTYPHIADLESRTSSSKPQLKLKTLKLIIAACLFVPLLIFMFMIPFAPLNIVSFVMCLSFSFIFLYPAVSLALNRFYILTGLSVLLSIVLLHTISRGDILLFIYLTLMGVALLISGEFTFRNFLRKNPLPQEELE